MSEERKTWYVGDVVWGTATMVYESSDDPHKGKFVCDCDPFMFDDETKMAGDGNPQHLAQQVADDHNRIPELKQALLALVEAAYRVTETVQNGQPPDTKARWVCCGEYWHDAHKPDCRHLALEKAIEKARTVLPTEQEGGTR